MSQKHTFTKRLFCAATAAVTAFCLIASVIGSNQREVNFTACGETISIMQAPSASSRTVVIKASPANVRSGAGTSYSVIGRTSKGKTFTYLGSAKEKSGRVWYKIQFTPSKAGWIMASLGDIKETAATTTTTAGNQNETETNATTATTGAVPTTTATRNSASKTVTITGKTVNVRTGAGTSFSKIGTTYKGKQFKYLSQKNDAGGKVWYRIQFTSDQAGWVTGSYSKLTEETDTGSTTATTTITGKTTTTTTKASNVKKVTITGNPVNVRSGAGYSFSKIGTTSRGKQFVYLSTKKDSSGKNWYQIQFTSSKTGWVIASLASLGGNGSTKGKVAYLTFDDGPSVNTLKILDILDEYDVKATFFVIYHSGMKKQYKAIAERGHTIALHSYTHDYSKIYKSEKAYFADLKKIHDYVEEITGVDSRIIRFPGGSSNTVSNKYNKGIMKKLKAEVTDKGYIYHDWNVSSTDAAGSNRKASVLLSHIKSDSGNKKTINVLMHDTGKSKLTTVEALPSIIEYLREQGYSFEALTEDSVVIQHGR